MGKRKAKLTVNIGLGNNHLSLVAMKNKLEYLSLFSEAEYIYKVGEYLGVDELTLVATGYTALKLSKVIEILENICTSMTQDCVAMTYNNVEILLYNPTTRIAPKDQLKFNPRLFLK